LGLKVLRTLYLGKIDNRFCFSAECEESTNVPEGMDFRSLRSLYTLLGEEIYWAAGQAFQIAKWDWNTQFCGQCGSSTEYKTDERAKICPKCDNIQFPRISPAIIVAVRNGNQILLARSKRYKKKMYSVLAGFVEPGENLEECLRREVKEETGVEVRNIRYFGSQPWPFPDSLMIAFTADYAGGEINIDTREIVDAEWFTGNNLPEIPEKPSIARELIESFAYNNQNKI
jgi:NAD+ diphosphatase